MACDTIRKPQQTLAQRREEIRKRLAQVDKLLASKRVTAKVGPQGAITFIGLSDTDRDGMTDACIYRQIARTGSVMAREAIKRAEMLAGKAVQPAALHAGIHSHDGGASWSSH